MKFSHFLQQNMVPEWEKAYIDYRYLKTLLKPFKIIINLNKIKKKKYFSINTKVIHEKPSEEWVFSYLKVFSSRFEEILIEEKAKIDDFLHLKQEEFLLKFSEIQRNIHILQEKSSKSPDFSSKKQQLNSCFLSFYKETCHLSEFSTINMNSFKKITKKQQKITTKFDHFSTKPLIFLIENLEKTQDFLHKIQQNLDTLYHDTFAIEIPHKNLQKITENIGSFSQKELYFFLFFSFFTLILLIIIIILAYKGGLDPDKEVTYFKEIFAMYRGISLFIIYLWILAWNVYIWTKFRINYQRIFEFNDHFSKFSDIMKKAAFFTTIFLLSFIWYIINCEEIEGFSKFFLWFPKEYCPLICWFFFIFYIVFP